MIPYEYADEMLRYMDNRRRALEAAGETYHEIKAQAEWMLEKGWDPREYGIHVPESAFAAFESNDDYYDEEETRQWLIDNGHDPKDFGL